MIEIGLRQLEEDGIIIIREEEIVLLEILPEDWGNSKDSNFQNAKKGIKNTYEGTTYNRFAVLREIQGVNGECDEVAELNLIFPLSIAIK